MVALGNRRRHFVSFASASQIIVLLLADGCQTICWVSPYGCRIDLLQRLTVGGDTLSNADDQPPGALNLNGLRVLVVEDSWQVGAALKRLLDSCGADVAGPVATVADAARLVSERTVDVALVDINLRGGELAYDLIDHLHGQGIRIVVVTGYADVSIDEKKVAAVLQKPVSRARLLQSLRPAA
jgi:CheY-like chemotaxis protein